MRGYAAGMDAGEAAGSQFLPCVRRVDAAALDARGAAEILVIGAQGQARPPGGLGAADIAGMGADDVGA